MQKGPANGIGFGLTQLVEQYDKLGAPLAQTARRIVCHGGQLIIYAPLHVISAVSAYE